MVNPDDLRYTRIALNNEAGAIPALGFGTLIEGKCKAIGLSDVSLEQAQDIFEAGRIKPAVVHVESHPYLPEWDLLNYCRANGIVLQAFAALGHRSEPKLLEDPVIIGIAKRLNSRTQSHL